MEWKEKVRTRSVGFVSGAISLLWACERILGLAGLPDDAGVWISMTGVIPNELAAAAFGAFLLFAWARWGDQPSVIVTKLWNAPTTVWSVVLYFTIFFVTFAFFLPWLGYVSLNIFAFSNAILLWVREDISFADAISKSFEVMPF